MRKEANGLIEQLAECYGIVDDFVKNPQKLSYFIMLRKIKTESKVPIDLRLLDFKIEIDAILYKALNRMMNKIGWYKDLPDGLKKEGGR